MDPANDNRPARPAAPAMALGDDRPHPRSDRRRRSTTGSIQHARRGCRTGGAPVTDTQLSLALGYAVERRQPLFDANVDRCRLSDDPVRSLLLGLFGALPRERLESRKKAAF